jgi:hypothetical protein
VAVARFLIKQWKEHGDEIAENPLKFAQKMDEEIKKMTGVSAAWRSRIDAMFHKMVEEAKSKDNPSGNNSDESDSQVPSEDESQVQGRGQHEGEPRVGGGYSRSERKPPGKHEGERVNRHTSEIQIHTRGPSKSGRTNPAAHIECVNNWLRDLSQIV